MRATFTKAIRYFVDIVCQSPLRTGGSGRDPKTVLVDSYQHPFVQGTSLAGAFRNWLNDPLLFSETDYRSPLMFSDLMLDDTELIVRPRLKIDGCSGTGASGAKFDTAAIPAGTRGRFQLIWTGDADPDMVAALIERYLSALNAGEITLGAQRANGFGRMSVSAVRRIYHMTNPHDLDAWLLGASVTDVQPVTLNVHSEQNVLFTVTASAPSILVKAAGSKRIKSDSKKDLTVFTSMEEAGRWVIPGSSLKGSIRSQMARICTAFGYHPSELERLFGRANHGTESGWVGVIQLSDGYLTGAQEIRVPRIRINRLTGGIIPQNLFFSDTLHTSLKFEIRISSDRKAGCALLLYALRDLGLGLYELGSGTAVGRGRLCDMKVHIQQADHRAQLEFCDDVIKLSDPDGLVSAWENALRRKVLL